MALIQRGNYYYTGWLKWRQMENTNLCVCWSCFQISNTHRWHTLTYNILHLRKYSKYMRKNDFKNVKDSWTWLFILSTCFWFDLHIKIQYLRSLKSTWAMCIRNVSKKITYMKMNNRTRSCNMKSSSFRVISETCFRFDSDQLDSSCRSTFIIAHSNAHLGNWNRRYFDFSHTWKTVSIMG